MVKHTCLPLPSIISYNVLPSCCNIPPRLVSLQSPSWIFVPLTSPAVPPQTPNDETKQAVSINARSQEPSLRAMNVFVITVLVCVCRDRLVKGYRMKIESPFPPNPLDLFTWSMPRTSSALDATSARMSSRDGLVSVIQSIRMERRGSLPSARYIGFEYIDL